jgi:HK97 family phage prohead protease
MVNRSHLPEQVLARLDVNPCELGIATRRPQANTVGNMIDVRTSRIELRAADGGTTRSLTGYATTWDTFYDVCGGPPWGWSETIAKGAATKSLAERDDVRFLVNHDGLPLARTKSGTMNLSADDLGLLVEVPSLDMTNPECVELCSAIDRGDVDEMSFAFQVMREEWSGDYTQRRILELRLFDVSAVTFPANPATIIGARNMPAPTPAGFSLSLALAQAAALGL